MIWSFNEDIAIYNDSGYLLIAKVKLIELIPGNEKFFYVDLPLIYTQGHIDVSLYFEILVQLREEIREYGIDNFQVYRRCEVCNELFLKTSKNKTICSGKCRTRKSRDKK